MAACRHSFRSLLLALTMALAPVPAFAGDGEDIQATISSQLDAFRAEDGARAYSFAAPNIAMLFPTPERFMEMVRQGYGPVYDSRSVTFGPMTAEGSRFRQEVYLSDAEGQSWIASYTLERQADGSMKITGVQIRRGNDLSA